MTPEQTLEATFKAGNLALARKMALTMLQQNVRNKVALQVLANIALLIGVSSEALSIATKALEVDSDDPRTNLLLADIHGARGQTEEALTYCDHVLSSHPGDFSALQIKARLLERSGDWHQAVELLGPHAAITPRTSLFTLTLARCLLQAEEFDAAIELIDATIPDISGDSPRAKQQHASLLGLRARIQDKAQRYEQAWADATQANQLRGVEYEPAALTEEVNHLIDWFSAERFEELDRAQYDAAKHVFIVGMPRSGTTLVEQILDAHEHVTGLGELTELDVMARMLPKTMQIQEIQPDILRFAETKRLTQLAEKYEKSIIQQGFKATSTYVNKNLRNPMLLGFIALLFPEAKVIFTSRDVRDTAVSSFLAGMNHELFPYLFNVEHIGLASADLQRLTVHWQKVIPLQWTTVNYETLVTDQESETRRLLEFCELDWDPACMTFWQSKRTVMTQSYDQVNRPMYSQSIGRYKNYAKHLGALQNS